MNAELKPRSDRFEQVARGMLVVALVAGVVWALASSSHAPLGQLLG